MMKQKMVKVAIPKFRWLTTSLLGFLIKLIILKQLVYLSFFVLAVLVLRSLGVFFIYDESENVKKVP